VARARRIVIKLGTRVLVNDDGSLAEEHLAAMVGSVARLVQASRQVIIVSSGAVGLGRALLGETHGLGSGARRLHAAVGQAQLVGRYSQELARHGLLSAQVLVTEQDFEVRSRYLALKETLQTLLRVGVVPVLNDNDAVSHGARNGAGSAPERAVFDDNDRLAALVAAKCEANLLLILTDVAAVYDQDPKKDLTAQPLLRVDEPERLLDQLSDGTGSHLSRGGMRSKIEAALVAKAAGCQVVIAWGRQPGIVEQVAAGAEVGSWILAEGAQSARRRWIAYAAVPKGTLMLDAGAVRALRRDGASLLPVGVTRVQGQFKGGDVVELLGPDGMAIGRAWIDLGADEVRAWCDGVPPEHGLNCLVRRDYIVLRSTTCREEP